MKLHEVESRLKKQMAEGDPAFIARYVGSVNHEKRKPDEQSKLIYLGLKVPTTRKLFQSEFSLSTFTIDEQFAIWHEVFTKSNIYDAKNLAVFWLDKVKDRKWLVKNWPKIKTWVRHVDNWAHSDTLSGVYARILEENPKVLSDFKKWNRSKNPWERRQSVVGLLFYSRFRKKTLPLKTILQLVHNLKDDKHFFVQKGVGWTLREIYNLNPALQLSYVTKHAKTLPAAGWTAISEKWPASTKIKIMKLRKGKTNLSSSQF